MRGLIMDPGVVLACDAPIRPLTRDEEAERDRFIAANRARGVAPGARAGRATRHSTPICASTRRAPSSCWHRRPRRAARFTRPIAISSTPSWARRASLQTRTSATAS